MIVIRSTATTATTRTKGLSDVVRTMQSYKTDDLTGETVIVIKSEFFQEKTVTKNVDGEEQEVVERKIVQSDISEAFSFRREQIDAFFSAYGTTISKTKSYSEQQDQNKMTILLAQTVDAQWEGMTEWIPDTEHTIVSNFTS